MPFFHCQAEEGTCEEREVSVRFRVKPYRGERVKDRVKVRVESEICKHT